MRRLADRGLERAREVQGADVHFGGHGLQAQIAIQMLFDVGDQPPHPPTGQAIGGSHAGGARAGGVEPRQVSRNHLRQRVDIQPVLGRAVAQGGMDGDGQLLQQRIGHGEARDQLRRFRIAAVHFRNDGIVNRLPQVDLQNLGAPVVLPLRDGIAGSEADASRADERFFLGGAGDLARDLCRTSQVIDQKRVVHRLLGRPERRFFHDGRVQRPPAGVGAVHDEPVSGTQHAAMSFANRKNRNIRGKHRRSPW